ncbi:ATPase [Candidatus Microgenomates bacterium]|nr:MAG: ATPase [Candidatus Microgenomates bacterium]
MIQVIKATGELEPFSEEKVRQSILRAGIPKGLENEVIEHIKSKLYENIPTSEIYNQITDYLGESTSPYSKAKYGLKQSLMSLGPTGFPFEDFIAKVLHEQGYETQVRQYLMGKCVKHEIDVIAQKENEKVMIEVKFHNRFGTRTDVQDALYTKARFDDVKEKDNFSQAWLVTNTKATSDAIAYCNCVGMKILSWSYPQDASLRSMIEKSKLLLITSLSSLTLPQKQDLLDNHIILCKDIFNNPSCLNNLNLSAEERKNVLAETEFVYKN